MFDPADQAMTIHLDYELPEYPPWSRAIAGRPAGNPT